MGYLQFFSAFFRCNSSLCNSCGSEQMVFALLLQKYQMVFALCCRHRANTICSDSQLLHKEELHLKNALKNCKYPTWALNRIQKKTNNPDKQQAPRNRNNNNNTWKKSYIVVPYYSGLSESIKNIWQKVWGTGVLQRRHHHQEPPDGSQRQRGVWLDDQLNFSHHAVVTCKAAVWNIHKIRMIRPYLNQQM